MHLDFVSRSTSNNLLQFLTFLADVFLYINYCCTYCDDVDRVFNLYALGRKLIKLYKGVWHFECSPALFLHSACPWCNCWGAFCGQWVASPNVSGVKVEFRGMSHELIPGWMKKLSGGCALTWCLLFIRVSHKRIANMKYSHIMSCRCSKRLNL